MWSNWLDNSTIPALEQSTAFAQRRHALLAGNMANLDVPGYRTRDLSVADFQNALRENIDVSKAGGARSAGSPSPQMAEEKVRDTQTQILYLDGSDVSLEHQVAEIAKNHMMHETAIALMRSQFQTLQAAIRESAAV